MPLAAFLPIHRLSLSLRAAIGLTVVFGVALASAVAYGVQAQQLRNDYHASIKLELDRLGALTALVMRDPLWQFAPEQGESIVEAVLLNPKVVAITVVDDKGQAFVSRVRESFKLEDSVSLVQPIMRSDSQLGTLTIRMSTAGYHARLDAVKLQNTRTALIIMAGALGFILLVLHYRFVRPLQSLVRASERLNQRLLDRPIVSERQDELGVFAASLEHTRVSLLALFGEIEQRNTALREANENLEQRVTQRTQSLEDALERHNQAQEDIVQTEKLASLGRVVAGVAHELNTPIGNALLVATTISHSLTELRTAFEAGTLRRANLTSLMDQTEAAMDVFMRNLERAARIIGDFKQVAVDQTSEQRREFDLAEVTGEILTTLHPAIRKSGCQIDVQTEADIRCDSFPGPFGQVLTNLVMNALVHGLEGVEGGGLLRIDVVRLDPQTAQMSVTDNGHGMDEEVLRKVFDPFFTTRMGRGGSGLGMNLVQGIVKRVLGGNLEIRSTLGQGTTVLVRMPLRAPEAVGAADTTI